MRRIYRFVVSVLFLLWLFPLQALGIEGSSRQAEPSGYLVVTFRSVSVDSVEADLTGFSRQFYLRKIEPLHREIVAARRGGKDFKQYADSIGKKYPHRGGRIRTNTILPDLSRSYVLQPYVSDLSNLQQLMVQLRHHPAVE